MTTESRSRLFRVGEKGAAVTNIELFFDLVFVFAITQLSHRLMLNLTPTGAVETLGLFLAVGVAGQVMHQAPLMVGTGATGALVTAAVWEWLSLKDRWQRLTPWLAPNQAANPDIAPGDAAG